MTKLFLEPEFQTKGNNKRKNANSQQNLAVFSAATGSEIKVTVELHGSNTFGAIKN